MPSELRTVTGRAHGKVIVSGEFSILYGQPAVVAGIAPNIMATVVGPVTESVFPTKYSHFYEQLVEIFSQQVAKLPPVSISIEGDLQLGAGMGGSAAVAAAVFRALAAFVAQPLSEAKLLELVMQAEQIAHGQASGIDPMAVVKGGVLACYKDENGLRVEAISPTILADKLFFLINSGQPAESTKEMVALVAQKISAKPALAEVTVRMGQITTGLIQNLTEGRWNATALTANQRCLEALGVVSPKALDLIHLLEQQGAAAKITGAGGQQAGSGMILAYHDQPMVLDTWLQTQHIPYQQISLGVRV